jgi:hypothetical protein
MLDLFFTILVRLLSGDAQADGGPEIEPLG